VGSNTKSALFESETSTSYRTNWSCALAGKLGFHVHRIDSGVDQLAAKFWTVIFGVQGLPAAPPEPPPGVPPVPPAPPPPAPFASAAQISPGILRALTQTAHTVSQSNPSGHGQRLPSTSTSTRPQDKLTVQSAASQCEIGAGCGWRERTMSSI